MSLIFRKIPALCFLDCVLINSIVHNLIYFSQAITSKASPEAPPPLPEPAVEEEEEEEEEETAPPPTATSKSRILSVSSSL